MPLNLSAGVVTRPRACDNRRGAWRGLCDAGCVLVVRATRKVLDRVGGVTAAPDVSATTWLGDWYVNVLFFRPQLGLFVSEVTLLPVLVAWAPAATLLER